MRRPERHSLEIVACCRSPAACDAKPPRGDLSLPPTSALVEYRSTSRPSASAQRTSSPSRSPPMARPGWSTWARPRDRRSATEHGRGRHRTGASFDAAAGLLHERLIAPLLPHPGTAELLDIALRGAQRAAVRGAERRLRQAAGQPTAEGSKRRDPSASPDARAGDAQNEARTSTAAVQVVGEAQGQRHDRERRVQTPGGRKHRVAGDVEVG